MYVLLNKKKDPLDKEISMNNIDNNKDNEIIKPNKYNFWKVKNVNNPNFLIWEVPNLYAHWWKGGKPILTDIDKHLIKIIKFKLKVVNSKESNINILIPRNINEAKDWILKYIKKLSWI